MRRITSRIRLDDGEIEERFIRASGPGGQNVNKTATAVQLRFNVTDSPSLPQAVRERLLRTAGRRVDRSGILTIEARRYRDQSRNREDALERLVALIRKAADEPAPRRRHGTAVWTTSASGAPSRSCAVRISRTDTPSFVAARIIAAWAVRHRAAFLR